MDIVNRGQAAVAAFEARERMCDRPSVAPAQWRSVLSAAREVAVPTFLNGRQLRDYQLASLRWMVSNMRVGRNCILGDEMARARAPPLALAGTYIFTLLPSS